jgi:hypothetical protein
MKIEDFKKLQLNKDDIILFEAQPHKNIDWDVIDKIKEMTGVAVIVVEDFKSIKILTNL